MWYFPTSPETWILIGTALVIYMVVAGIKSAGSKILAPIDKSQADASWKKYKEATGPISWQEYIFYVVMFSLFVAFVVWLANVT